MGRYGLGDFEAAVLLTVHHLHGKGYAVSIAEQVGKLRARSVTLGAIYATLDRLEKKGFVASELSEPTPERGGRPKRFYRIQAPGLHALSEAYAADRRRWSAFPPIGAPV